MLGVHYFNCPQFSQQAQCSERAARRWLRPWLRDWKRAHADDIVIGCREGEHIRLDARQFKAALAAYQQRQRFSHKVTSRRQVFILAIQAGKSVPEAALLAGYKSACAGHLYRAARRWM